MLKSLLALLASVAFATAVYLYSIPEAGGAVLWEGETGLEMLHQVRADLAPLKRGDILQVTLVSPGGNVVTSLEIARLVREASDRGVIVEIHATALCASGCTFVLAAGTPGHRFIGVQTLYLVHPIQAGMGSCVDRKAVEGQTGQDAKILNTLYDFMVASYARYSGHPASEIETWFVCGQEQAGGGVVAVKLGLADRTE